MTTPEQADDTTAARTAALARGVRETEQHVAADGWDAPVRVFALVRTADALAADPSLASVLPDDGGDPDHLTAVEQEGLPNADSLEDLLAQLAWPDAVDGAAVVVERLVVPPSVEAELANGDAADADSRAAVEALSAHPEARDVRIAVGVLRTGESWCALRARTHDTADQVVGGPDTVPGLVAALGATLE
ncbi:PPA1309 family protein [Litorihabitans aurantiacus]|uniref:Uncharacterized protein n=1 Tax=Litorihabitans aurantiacus TaxID=1930061 RepID=A0AA37XFB8_9MICO|nr:PPA1309 family protein [Litorihabitans aurantiacus]GMA32115.1 hypothetical protein GCM10025875_21070 [Litorihabitans aurantiacus]